MSHMHDYSIAVSVRILKSISPNIYTVPEPDLEISGGSQKNFSALWASLWSKNKGGGGGGGGRAPGPAPGPTPATYIFSRLFSTHFFKKLVERI